MKPKISMIAKMNNAQKHGLKETEIRTTLNIMGYDPICYHCEKFNPGLTNGRESIYQTGKCTIFDEEGKSPTDLVCTSYKPTEMIAERGYGGCLSNVKLSLINVHQIIINSY